MLKILIVDDSLVYRSIIAKVLGEIPGVQIAASLRSGPLALEWLKSNAVDLVTLDMEMPEMTGQEVLSKIQDLKLRKELDRKTEVVVLSSHTPKGATSSIQALTRGAFEVIAKPTSGEDQHTQLKKHFEEIVQTLKSKMGSPTAKLTTNPISTTPIQTATQPSTLLSLTQNSKYKAIVIGISTGGPRTLTEILPKICTFTDLPILLVQHMPTGFTKAFAESLDKICSHRIKEAEHHEAIENKTVYIAPGGSHMVVSYISGSLRIKITDSEAELNCKPSVNVLFRSIAQTYGGNVIAAILTGMGTDGAAALQCLHERGAKIIAQDEESSVVYGMPKAAIDTGLVHEVANLSQIPNVIHQILKDN